MLNKRGPNIEPCGTPYNMSLQLLNGHTGISGITRDEQITIEID